MLSLVRCGSAEIARMRDRWKNAGLAKATFNRRLSILSSVFRVAAKEWGMPGLINPVAEVEKPQVRDERDRRVSDAEQQEIGKASESPLLPHFLVLAVETAMRRGELCRLRWEDIDLKSRVAHLSTKVTKNGYARDVPLSSRAIATLKSLQRSADGRVFEMRPDSVTQAFDRAVKRARESYEKTCKESGGKLDLTILKNLRLHDLRHEATSRLANIFGAHELAKITGHRDLRMLMRYYHPDVREFAKQLP